MTEVERDENKDAEQSIHRRRFQVIDDELVFVRTVFEGTLVTVFDAGMEALGVDGCDSVIQAIKEPLAERDIGNDATWIHSQDNAVSLFGEIVIVQPLRASTAFVLGF